MTHGALPSSERGPATSTTLRSPWTWTARSSWRTTSRTRSAMPKQPDRPSRMEQDLGKLPGKLVADAGYGNKDTLDSCQERRVTPVCATTREGKEGQDSAKLDHFSYDRDQDRFACPTATSSRSLMSIPPTGRERIGARSRCPAHVAITKPLMEGMSSAWGRVTWLNVNSGGLWASRAIASSIGGANVPWSLSLARSRRGWDAGGSCIGGGRMWAASGTWCAPRSISRR